MKGIEIDGISMSLYVKIQFNMTSFWAASTSKIKILAGRSKDRIQGNES